MAQQFCDSFDHYTTAYLSGKYGGIVGTPAIVSTGRESQGLKFNNASSYVTPKQLSYVLNGTIIFACATNAPLPVSSGSLFRDQDAAVFMNILPSGAIAIGDAGGVEFTSASGLFLPSTWQYWTMVYNSSTKVCSAYLGFNGTPVVTGTLPFPNSIAGSNKWIGDPTNGFTGTLTIDDLVMMDGTGTTMNAFQGDMKILPYYVLANGTLVQWTPSAGSNYQNVNNQASGPNPTNYNQSPLAGDIDNYTLGPTPVVTSVLAAQVVGYLTASTAGSVTCQLGVSNGGAANFTGSPTFSLSTVGSYYLNPLSINPLTGVAWTLADLTTLQAAVKDLT